MLLNVIFRAWKFGVFFFLAMLKTNSFSHHLSQKQFEVSF